MSKKSNLLQIFILIIVVCLSTHCGLHTKVGESGARLNAGGDVFHPADEAKIEGIAPEYTVSEKTLASLQTLPMPEFRFVFASKTVPDADLPEDVKTLLRSHWKESLKFKYDEYFNKPADAQSNYNRDSKWFAHCDRISRELQERFIEAPGGKRKISATEASQLIAFLIDAAFKTVARSNSL